ncbi:Fe-S protein assembly co-chaperone HscB [Buchnera aphidicola (Pemphigus obesinymphae)]|uniref:Fe-S protein assembly co-chaperone HscB n=1 Tax=Buchnera aphidicola TaxID=9 RepID=UPI002236F2A6|nr:Fe-S protein assembly co-chaperone HscB [Buchnera aphidicola]MCW5196744.1 Fe-S protein assembly co-chaperone HscB [Buchnera aphidicola (Pemphigus obesinymphae)]
MNYFKLFDLPEKFDIEVTLLSKKFYQLQRKYHPDLFNNCSKSIKKNVLNNSTIVNKGYRTLKDPLTRAKHLLYLNGFNVISENKSIYEKDFLIEQFNFYEEIDRFKKNLFNLDHFNHLLTRVNKIQKKYEREMIKAFEVKCWVKAAGIVNKLFFFRNLKNSLEKLQE